MKPVKFILLALVLTVSAAGVSRAEEDQTEADERDMEATQCVHINRIDAIDIVDSRTLVFRMLGDEVYRNDLPYKCVGLKPGDTLMYRSSLGQLCNVDIITVLQDWGFGFAPGASCGLGMFHPITGQIADELNQENQ